jgi:hypothetical protein
MARTPTSAATSTAQQLGSSIKSARDLMRKDKGLNGDLDRLPMLTWILFLKFLDDLERAHEAARRMGRRSCHRTKGPYTRRITWEDKGTRHVVPWRRLCYPARAQSSAGQAWRRSNLQTPLMAFDGV